ncbi:MAG: calcium-translocating P-type ATPase, PMCA-type [Victivallales bacterium]|nr:calcium-translocating P-type ATPase, PMCA-type [Victivallales bacterium]
MKFSGLTKQQVEESRRQNGSNALTDIPPEPLWAKILEGFKDPMIMILLVALVIQIVLFCFGKAEWYEPFGIFVAIIIANGVAAVFENKQEGKASALKHEENAKEKVKAVRESSLMEIPLDDVVVGDVIFLQAGDKIPADGILLEGSLKVDQAALNGESEEAPKVELEKGGEYNTKDLLNKYYIYRGTVICSGEAYQEVKVVGDKTEFGQAALAAQEETRETPLQVKLGKLANQISMFGYIGAAAIVAIILMVTIFTGKTPDGWSGWLRLLVDAVTVAVTIIVCAVPEGLPMLSSILQALQSLKMVKDNVLVRKINGLETAGSLSILFSDKTGTITEGRLSVVEMATGGQDTFDNLSKITDSLRNDILIGVGVNNSSIASEDGVLGGNGTDRALMSFLVSNGLAKSINKEEVVTFNAFDSNKKCSSIVVNHGGSTRIYIKGAPERIIDRCKKYVDLEGQEQPLEDTARINAYLNEQAGRSMRLLAVAKADGDKDDVPLTLVCIISIRDNVRKEVKDAVREIQNAGIQVVMVTGDRKETAVAIAKEAGLLTSENDVALTSFELAEKSDDELKELLPRLRVVSRALPLDKSRLVKNAQELNLVVGMTGDGVNDSPALRKADVGFAMGSGTEVAKEAGEITILDDNLSSIEKAILYGRSMFKSIRKFLVFQLTVNVAAVLTCAIGPMFGQNVVMTVIQLLLINLAMDTLAAIAFGSEPPLKEYMKEKPIPRSESIVSAGMLTEIIVSALYITGICLSILFVPKVQEFIGAAGNEVYLKSALFATFMMAITCNGFNARTAHLNPFEGIGRNITFLVVMGVIFLLQFVFVEFGGKALAVTPLSAATWGKCLLLAFLVIPIDIIRKLIIR